MEARVGVGVEVEVTVVVMLLGGKREGLLAAVGVGVDHGQDPQDPVAGNQAPDQRPARDLEAEQEREASLGVGPGKGVDQEAGLGVGPGRGANLALVQAVGADLEAGVDQDLLQGRGQELLERGQGQAPRLAQIIEFDIGGSDLCNIIYNVVALNLY